MQFTTMKRISRVTGYVTRTHQEMR